MGLLDVWRRLTGRDREPQRGVRRGRREVRRPDERTVQMRSPGAYGAPGEAPPQPPYPSAPAPYGGGGGGGPGVAPTVATPVPAFEQPPAPAPPPPAPSPPPQAPAPGAGSRGISSAATQYLSVPQAPKGGVVGVLVAVDGELEGTLCAVRDGENKLGRAEDCEIVLPSVKISREHAKIVHSDGVFAIVPLKEENPTFVNEEATEGAELRDGDLVRLGQTTLRFRTIQGP